MSEFRTFKTDALRELGTYAEESQNILVQMSLQFPSKYYENRAKLMKAILQENVKNIYNTVWNALTNGTDINGTPIIRLDGQLARYQIELPDGSRMRHYQPRFAEQKVNDIAYAVTKAFKKVIEDELVDQIMPNELYKAALERTAARTASDLASGGIRTSRL